MQSPDFDRIDVPALQALLEGGHAFALFDARDEGLFARSHMLFASPLPLSDLEVRLFRLVPRQETLIVFTSMNGDGMAERAASRCRALGYRNVRLLRGGNEAWERAGFTLFPGIHVPSKAFGEWVEGRYHTPMIEPHALHELIDSGAPVRIFDCRPPHEFRRMSLPGARNCPGADLLSRVPALVDPETIVVINCAGRTRGIIGAQSLINAGVRNRIVTLKNGTMGWHLAGFPLEHDKNDLVEPPASAELEPVRESAARLREEYAIPEIGLDQLQALQVDERNANLMLLDVRGPWEFEAGHLPGSRNAPGGQLIQATDDYVGVRNAPIVLVDDDGIRASITATWLVQMGFRSVRVLDHRSAFDAMNQTSNPPSVPPHLVPNVEATDPTSLQADLDRGTTLLLDFGSSDSYYKGHVPGARFVIRSRLADSLRHVARHETVTLVAEDATTAAFAAKEVEQIYGAPARVLEGGTAAWRNAGLALDVGLDDAIDPPEDMWHIPSSPLGGLDSAMRDYLSWEVGLAEQAANEPGARFAPAQSPAKDVHAPQRRWLDIAPIFRHRWSRRAMSGDALESDEIQVLFEAARWAPSCNNSQPWRFVYAIRGSHWWDDYFDVLTPGNKRWAGQGALLGFMLSLRTNASGKPLRSHAFDTGAAWQNMALQAAHLGLVMHGMLGFDQERARSLLELDTNMEIQAMFVVGRVGLAEILPADLQQREVPSGRLPLQAIAFEGRLKPMDASSHVVLANEVKEAL